MSAELLAEVIVRLRVARQTIYRIQDYSICFEEVYLLLQTFIATVRYTLQIDENDARLRGYEELSQPLQFQEAIWRSNLDLFHLVII